MAYEWLTQRHAALKRRRMGLAPAAAGSSKRVKLGPGEVFLLGEADRWCDREQQLFVSLQSQAFHVMCCQAQCKLHARMAE
jgi:hypothetical protein